MLRSRSNFIAEKSPQRNNSVQKQINKPTKNQRTNNAPSVSTIIFCGLSFALTCFISSINYTKFLRHHHESHSKFKHLRGIAVHEKIGNHDGSQVSEIDDIIPAGSIYSLEYPSMKHHGELFSLSAFAGRISIVINVACA